MLDLCVSCSSFCWKGGLSNVSRWSFLIMMIGKGNEAKWVCLDGTVVPGQKWTDMDDAEVARLLDECEMEATKHTEEFNERITRIMRGEVLEPEVPTVTIVPCPCVKVAKHWHVCCNRSRGPGAPPRRPGDSNVFENQYDPTNPDFYDPEPARSRSRTPPRRL